MAKKRVVLINSSQERTLLMQAIDRGDSAVVAELLAHHASCACPDGRSVYNLAALSRNPDLARLISEHMLGPIVALEVHFLIPE
jgi:hypothetical protein